MDEYFGEDANQILDKKSVWKSISTDICEIAAVAVFLVILAVLISTALTKVPSQQREIYENYGRTLEVTDVTLLAGGKADTWTAQCVSSNDKNLSIVLEPIYPGIKAPEKGMTISYQLAEYVPRPDEGETPEAFVSDWNEMPEQQEQQ